MHCFTDSTHSLAFENNARHGALVAMNPRRYKAPKELDITSNALSYEYLTTYADEMTICFEEVTCIKRYISQVNNYEFVLRINTTPRLASIQHHSWHDWWSNRSIVSYFSFQPVFHDWCNKGRGMCYPVCEMMHVKEPLLLIGESSPCGGSGLPVSLSEWSFTTYVTPYNRK